MKRKLIVYIAMSLDGYIADVNGSLEFLKQVEQEGEDYGYHEFIQQIDTIILGRKTYESLLSLGYNYPHTNKSVYILTQQTTLDPQKFLPFTLYSGSLKTLIHKFKSQEGACIYCDGGAEIVQALLKEELVDELIISVIPTLLGGGTALFQSSKFRPKDLKLIGVKSYSKGLVQMHYEVLN